MLYGATTQIEEMGVTGNFITPCRNARKMQLENGMRLIKRVEIK